jgi:hypothetical protein
MDTETTRSIVRRLRTDEVLELLVEVKGEYHRRLAEDRSAEDDVVACFQPDSQPHFVVVSAHPRLQEYLQLAAVVRRRRGRHDSKDVGVREHDMIVGATRWRGRSRSRECQRGDGRESMPNGG